MVELNHDKCHKPLYQMFSERKNTDYEFDRITGYYWCPSCEIPVEIIQKNLEPEQKYSLRDYVSEEFKKDKE